MFIIHIKEIIVFHCLLSAPAVCTSKCFQTIIKKITLTKSSETHIHVCVISPFRQYLCVLCKWYIHILKVYTVEPQCTPLRYKATLDVTLIFHGPGTVSYTHLKPC